MSFTVFFLWALKISFALGYRDTALGLDRANPDAGPLLPIEVVEDTGIFAPPYSVFVRPCPPNHLRVAS